MKKFLTIGLVVFMLLGRAGTSFLSANTAVGMDLDSAIKEAAAQMEKRIPAGTLVALVSMASPSTTFSTQVLTRLESAIVTSGKLIVVDRANLDKIRAEQGFQLSGEVDDESAKSIGKLLGAGAIVTGSLTDLGDVYSLTLKAINMETATVVVSYLADLAKTARVETLLAAKDGAASGGTTTGMATRPASSNSDSQAGTSQSVQAKTVQPAVPVSTEPPVSPTYKIGDRGPAGGWIFYDKGNNLDGWRYLEAAPADKEFKVEWGAAGTKINETGVVVGTGKTNTQRILPFLDQLGENNKAARLCVMLNINGYNDWFLPSKGELDWMYINLKRNGIGDFGSAWYWSSSEYILYGSIYSWVQNFGDGSQDDGTRSNSYSVRAIRQF